MNKGTYYVWRVCYQTLALPGIWLWDVIEYRNKASAQVHAVQLRLRHNNITMADVQSLRRKRI